MSKSSYMQTNFLGGLWSKFFQGRAEHPSYKTAMNESRNGYPIEEGAWMRRQGTRLMAPTFKGLKGRLMALAFTAAAPYQIELTDDGANGYMRFYNSNWLVATEDLAIMAGLSTAKPAVLTLMSPVNWFTGDEIAFIPPPGLAGTNVTQLRQRTFIVTVTSGPTPDAWDSATSYIPNIIVTNGGITYICILANINQAPPNATYWQVLGVGANQYFTLKDSITGLDLDGSTITLGIPAGVVVVRALRVSTPWINGAWENVRLVQNQDVALMLEGGAPPQILQVNPNIGSTQAANASLQPARFLDGPYLDPIPGSIATISGGSGVVGVTITFQVYDSSFTYMQGDNVTSGAFSYTSLTSGNQGNTPASSPLSWRVIDSGLAVTGNPFQDAFSYGFQDTDVGRQMRFLSTPIPWQAGTYVAGNQVYWQQLAYTCTTNGTTTQPDQDPIGWNVNPSGVYWTWGTITEVINGHNVNVQVQGLPFVYSTPVTLWRLGVYSLTTGYPTCGLFEQGRFWLGGSQPNRFDSSMSQGVLADGRIVMSPTGPGAQNVTNQLIDDGTVNDANGISYTLESNDKNPMYWMTPTKGGVLMGTLGGEWVVDSTNGSDPITPTNIQANRVTKYGCANIEPVHTGIATIFVQKFKRRIMEFLSDVFTGRHTAPHLNEAAKSLTANEVAEIRYQEELAPIVWARVNPCENQGDLIGATYRRISAFTTEPPKFVGWHRHDLGTGRNIESISVGGSESGQLDALAMVTGDPELGTSQGLTTAVRWAEMLTKMYDEDDSIYDAWFVDGGIVPDTMFEDTNGLLPPTTGQRFTGLWQFKGSSVTLFAGGLDLGEYTVDASGTIFVPYGSGIQPKTIDYCTSGSGKWAFTKAYIDFIISLKLPNRNPVASTSITILSPPPTSTPVGNPNNTSKIQSILPTNGQGAADDWGFGVDWQGGFAVIGFSAHATGATAYRLSDGTDHARESFTWSYPSGMGFDNGLWYHGGTGGNFSPLIATTETTMVDSWSYGASSTFGPPSSPGIPSGGDILVLKANSVWIVCIGNNHDITLNQGSSHGTFFGGNTSSSPPYEGLGLQPWAFESNATQAAPGAPTHQNNVATAYALNVNNQFVNPSTVLHGVGVWIIGVADGVPTDAQNTINGGKKGKGKTKKGAGVGQVPSTDNPQKLFFKLGSVTPNMVDPLWENGWDFALEGIVIDQFDNSVITNAALAYTNDGSWENYSATHMYNFNPDPKAPYNPLTQETTTTTGTYVVGNIVTNGVHPYICIQNSPPGTLLTNTSFWTQIPVWNAQAGQQFAIVGQNDPLIAFGPAFRLYAALQTNLYGVDPAVLTNLGTSCATPPLKPWMQIQNAYIIKVQTGQGSRSGTDPFGVKWVVPINNTYKSIAMNQGRIQGGLYGWLSWRADGNNSDGHPNFPCYLIDTTTGSWFAVDIGGLNPTSGENQAWDDLSESMVIGYMNYTSTFVNAPVALNSTVSSTFKFWRLYVGADAPASPSDILHPVTSASCNSIVQPTLNAPPTGKQFVFPDIIVNGGGFQQCQNAGGFPAVAGFCYQSDGQTLRPLAPDATADREGVAFGATRRTHYWTGLLKNTIQMKFGVDFGNSLTCMTLKDGQDGNTGNQIMPTKLFDGFVRYPLKDPYTYDSMLSWRVERPFPATVVAVGGKLETNDV